MAGKKTVPLPIRWRDAVTEHPNVNSVEWAIAMALSMRMDNKSGECYPGFASLGRVTRLSRTSVKKGIKGLESKGLVRVRRRRISPTHNDTNIYTAVLPRAQAHTEVGRQATPVSSETQADGRSAPPGQPEPQARLEKHNCRDCGRRVVSREGARCHDCTMERGRDRSDEIPAFLQDPE